MSMSFKQWLSEETGMAIGANGKNSHPTQSAQAAEKISQNWLSQDANSSQAAKLATGSRSTKPAAIMKAAATATEIAPNSLSGKTTAPQVASALSDSFGIKPAFKAKFMRKK